MSRLIAWDDIQPGMEVYVEEKPRNGYPNHWNLAWDLEAHEITDRLPNGRLRFRVDYLTEVGIGRLTEGDPMKVRYWTDGQPSPNERESTPWPGDDGK